MEFPAWLSAQLSELTEVLDDPATDLQAILAVLIDDVTVAVPSFLGLRMTLEVAGEPVTVTAIGPTAARTARSSLHLPLDPLAGAGPGSVVVSYTGNADAFAELARDRAALRARRPGPARPAPARRRRGQCAGRGVRPRSGQAAVIHRAIGCLIGQGLPPEDAVGELRRRAKATGRTLTVAAQHLLDFGNPGTTRIRRPDPDSRPPCGLTTRCCRVRASARRRPSTSSPLMAPFLG